MELCTTVGEILERKGHLVHAVSPDTSVYDALKLMAAKNVGAVLVMDQDHLMGIMSERDYARKVVLAGRLSHGTSVSGPASAVRRAPRPATRRAGTV